MIPQKIALLNSIPSEEDIPLLYLKLHQALLKYGFVLEILKNSHFTYQLDQHGSQIWYKKEFFQVQEYSLAFLRFAIKAPHSGDYYIAREFMQQNIPVINTPASIIQTRDKLQTLQNFSYLGLPITPTFVVRTQEDIHFALEKIKQCPYIIIKNIFGSGGQSVLQAQTYSQVRAIFDYIWNLDRNQILLIQPYLGEFPARDVRALYFNNQLWRAIERHSQYDFRANVHIGGITEITELTEEEEKICKKAVKASGLILAGLDFLRTPQGPMILEINGCPGLTGVSSAYQKIGIDITKELAEKLANYVQRK